MQTHGKHNLFMTYYLSHKAIYSTKFMGIILILPIRNYNYITLIKAHVHYKPVAKLLIL